MNKRQKNYLTMTRATLATMETRREEWETIVPVSDTVAKVTGLVNTIETGNQEREGLTTKGLTKQ